MLVRTMSAGPTQNAFALDRLMCHPVMDARKW
jgi:hypothetical protein